MLANECNIWINSAARKKFKTNDLPFTVEYKLQYSSFSTQWVVRIKF